MLFLDFLPFLNLFSMIINYIKIFAFFYKMEIYQSKYFNHILLRCRVMLNSLLITNCILKYFLFNFSNFLKFFNLFKIKKIGIAFISNNKSNPYKTLLFHP